MFASPNTFYIDESKLCFNKTHFNREDFNVERFMNLARQKSDLKTIQQDLRLYLKSVQNSMIELINDDYADFVHLSSNLVSLQDSLNKIEQDINRIWDEFKESTRESVGMAERIEQKCDELCSNREKQIEIRDRIYFLVAIEKLSEMLLHPPRKCSALWLQKAASFASELKGSTFPHSEEENAAEKIILSQLEAVLCAEGVRSAAGDCQNLPLIYSILSLTESTHSLTALLVSDLLYAEFVNEKHDESNQLKLLKQVFESVKKMRETWAEKMGTEHFRGNIRRFLDETLLTFILTFIDKCMGAVAVPSDTRLFHECFLLTQEFIDNWPSSHTCRAMLKSIRDKFNLLVYFKLETHRFGKQCDQLMSPEMFAEPETSENRENTPQLHCGVSRAIITAIEHVWSDDVYLPPIVDKLWDFTLKLLLKHFSWSQTMKNYFMEEKRDWTSMVTLRSDTGNLHQLVFDFALESIWGKFHDITVDTAPFGQCLTKHGRSIDSLCVQIDDSIIEMFSEVLHQEIAQVSDVPKQYRWTKKSPPTTHSKYVVTAIEMVENLKEKLCCEEHPHTDEIVRKVNLSAFNYFVGKGNEVLDSVEATGSSLSRFKRKTTTDSGSTVTDDDKIKQQIYHDAKYFLSYAENLVFSQADLTGLQEVVNRFDKDARSAIVQEKNQNEEAGNA